MPEVGNTYFSIETKVRWATVSNLSPIGTIYFAGKISFVHYNKDKHKLLPNEAEVVQICRTTTS